VRIQPNREAMFYRKMYRKELEKMLASQEEKPGRRLFFQPHAKRTMASLRDANPNEECPVTVYFSTTDDLSTVSWQAEIVEWRNKQRLAETECPSIGREIKEVGFNEGLFGIEKGMINLIRIRNLIKLVPSFHVSELIKVSDWTPPSGDPRSSYSHSYVYNRAEYPQMIIKLMELVKAERRAKRWKAATRTG